MYTSGQKFGIIKVLFKEIQSSPTLHLFKEKYSKVEILQNVITI